VDVNASSRCPIAWPIEDAARLLRWAVGDSTHPLAGHTLSGPYGKAYSHPNGFTKIPIATFGAAGCRLTLHIWHEHFRDGDIHDHRWAFASVVLAGEIINTEYRPVCDDRGSLEQYMYTPSADGTSFSLHPTGRIFNEGAAARALIRTGESYSMALGQFHRAESGDLTATLVMRGPVMQSSATMLLRRQSGAPTTGADGRNRSLTARDVHRSVRSVLKLL
jgi:hypothetical protein